MEARPRREEEGCSGALFMSDEKKVNVDAGTFDADTSGGAYEVSGEDGLQDALELETVARKHPEAQQGDNSKYGGIYYILLTAILEWKKSALCTRNDRGSLFLCSDGRRGVPCRASVRGVMEPGCASRVVLMGHAAACSFKALRRGRL
ncbi:hypothetical protein NDU88_001690 [Pleurodeles waltl]|uniref:Uncharacterized protein n=1 Tax=Pleurodeles waltl TaxID=8319 RepID=A0AAV7VCM9_PLEWA|nr:hypothetical protein NDU88_001690 [Pleurodeles waltl]